MVVEEVWQVNKGSKKLATKEGPNELYLCALCR